MGRIRTIKPEWLTDEKLSLASAESRVLSVALILMSDDYGNGPAGPLYIAGQVFEGHSDPSSSIAVTSSALAELEQIGYAEIYTVNGRPYFHIANWSKHQKVDKPGKPLVPGPERADSRESRESLANDSRMIRESLAPDHDHDHDPDPDPYVRLPAERPTQDSLPGLPEPDVASPDNLGHGLETLITDTLEYLNSQTGDGHQTFRPTSKSHRKNLRARITERPELTLDDLQLLIDGRVKVWKGTKFEEYLRPSTIFGQEKFDGYLAAGRNKNRKPGNGSSLLPPRQPPPEEPDRPTGETTEEWAIRRKQERELRRSGG